MCKSIGPVCVLRGHSAPVTCLDISPTSDFILSGSEDSTVRVWGVTEAREQYCFRGHTEPVLAVSTSPPDSVVSVSRDRTLRRWDVNSAREVLQFGLHEAEVTGAAFSINGEQALVSGRDGWRTEPETFGDKLRRQRGQDVLSRRTPDPLSTTIRCWRSEGEQELPVTPSHPTDEQIHALALTDNGRFGLISTKVSDRLFSLHVLAIDNLDDRLPFLSVNTRDVIGAFSRNGRRLLLCCESADPCGTDRRTLRLWNVSTGEEFPLRFRGHTGEVNCVTFTPDGCQALSGGDDAVVLLWDVKTANQLWYLVDRDMGPVGCVAVSEDYRYAAAGCHDGTIRVWKLPGR